MGLVGHHGFVFVCAIAWPTESSSERHCHFGLGPNAGHDMDYVPMDHCDASIHDAGCGTCSGNCPIGFGADMGDDDSPSSVEQGCMVGCCGGIGLARAWWTATPRSGTVGEVFDLHDDVAIDRVDVLLF